MAIDSSSFLTDFPEFDSTPVKDINAKIAQAELQVDAKIWGTKADLGVGYLTAHLLAMSSNGQFARLVPAKMKATREDALTTYEREYKRIMRMVASGFRVTGTDQS